MKTLFKWGQGGYPGSNVRLKTKGKKLYIELLTDYGSHSKFVKLIVKYDEEEKTYTLIEKKPEDA